MTFEHSTSLITKKRNDYGILQWAADVGGLYNLLSKLFMFLLSFLVAGGAHIFVGMQLLTKARYEHGQANDESQPELRRLSTLVSERGKDVQEHCCLIVKLKMSQNRLCRPCLRKND